jgi:spore cortex biosynthesis protein YabQ
VIIPPQAQFYAFGGAFLVGVALGLFYDTLRPFRLRAPPLLSGVLDMLFWLAAALAVFLCAPLLGDGRVRIYMVAAHILGAFCYFLLFSRGIRVFSQWVDRVVSCLFRLLMHPIGRLFVILAAPLSYLFQNVKNSAKKFFSFSEKWVKMKQAKLRGAGLARRKQFRAKRAFPAQKRKFASREEDSHALSGQNQKGWYSDEDYGGDSSGVRHRGSRADQREDSQR